MPCIGILCQKIFKHFFLIIMKNFVQWCQQTTVQLYPRVCTFPILLDCFYNFFLTFFAQSINLVARRFANRVVTNTLLRALLFNKSNSFQNNSKTSMPSIERRGRFLWGVLRFPEALHLHVWRLGFAQTPLFHKRSEVFSLHRWLTARCSFCFLCAPRKY